MKTHVIQLIGDWTCWVKSIGFGGKPLNFSKGYWNEMLYYIRYFQYNTFMYAKNTVARRLCGYLIFIHSLIRLTPRVYLSLSKNRKVLAVTPFPEYPYIYLGSLMLSPQVLVKHLPRLHSQPKWIFSHLAAIHNHNRNASFSMCTVRAMCVRPQHAVKRKRTTRQKEDALLNYSSTAHHHQPG